MRLDEGCEEKEVSTQNTLLVLMAGIERCELIDMLFCLSSLTVLLVDCRFKIFGVPDVVVVACDCFFRVK